MKYKAELPAAATRLEREYKEIIGHEVEKENDRKASGRAGQGGGALDFAPTMLYSYVDKDLFNPKSVGLHPPLSWTLTHSYPVCRK